jgi:hypothetical protein
VNIQAKNCLPLIGLLTFTITAWASEFSFKGYLKETPMVWKPSTQFYTSSTHRFDNLLHSRQNFKWFANENIDFGIELKTRLFIGESAGEMQLITDAFSIEDTYFKWDKTFISEEHTVLKSEIDRACFNFNKANLQLTLGRQRIAWGTNLVWNVIDLFNPASPLDFDNEERPGTDAVRMQYYTGSNSQIDIAYEPNRVGENSAWGGLFKFNQWDYDFLLLGGHRWRNHHWGVGWAGQISGGGFRGEMLCSAPDSQLVISKTELSLALSGDYTFSNSTYLHTEFLYNSAPSFYNLSPAKYSIFAEFARELSPLVRIDLPSIINPIDKSFYIGPSIFWSVVTNVDFTAMALFFGGESGTEFGDSGEIVLARLKWSF